METLVSFLLAVLITMFFVRRYVRGLAGPRQAPATAGHAPAAALPTVPCPRCSQPIPEGSSFCARCGAALALWNVHRAAVQPVSGNGSGKAAEPGKPRPVINASLCIGCGSCVDACPETGTLAMVKGKAILANPERCTGHAKCVEVCPTQGITLAFGNTLQTMRVPLVKPDFETNVPGLYIAGELGGIGLIKTGINEGRLVIDSIKAKLEGAPAAAEGVYDVAIVGSGPAGLSAALTAHQAELKYICLEQGEIAATIRHYPRHKLVFAEPLEMPMYGNLYMSDGSKEALISIWENIIANTGVHIETNTKVENLRRTPAGFAVETSRGEYVARTVVLATGKRGSPRKLQVPGEELGKVVYRLIEAESYNDSDALVVGGGDSAIECALALSKGGRNRVTLSYRGEDFARLKARNHELLKAAEAEGRVRVLRKSNVREIRPESAALEQDGRVVELPNSFVFVLIGGESPEGFLKKIGVEIVEKVVTG